MRKSTLCVFCVVILVAAAILYYYQPTDRASGAIDLTASITVDGGAYGTDWMIGLDYDEAHDILYVTGSVTVLSEGADIFLGKYNGDLSQIANTTYSGSSHGDDMGYVVTLGEDGFLYVVGYISVTGQGRNLWAAKFTSDLVLVTNVTYDGNKHETDELYGVILDESGHLFVTGTVTMNVTGYDIFIAELDSDLNMLRGVTIDGPASKTDKGRFMAFDSEGYLYVSGSMSQEVTGYDIWIGKLDSDLTLVDQVTIAGPVTGEDKGYGLLVSETDHLYVCGTMTTAAGGYDLWLAEFDQDLVMIQNITEDGPSSGEDVGYSIAWDDSMNLLVTGAYTEPAGGTNILLARFSRDLENLTWYTQNGPAGGYDSGFGVVRGQAHEAFLSGFVTDATRGVDGFIAAFEV